MIISIWIQIARFRTLTAKLTMKLTLNFKSPNLILIPSLPAPQRTMPNVSLSLFVVEQKCRNFDSFWKFYLDACPTTYSTTLHFDWPELAQLKASPAFELSVKMFRNICRQYAYFYQRMASPLSNFGKLTCSKRFTFDLYR